MVVVDREDLSVSEREAAIVCCIGLVSHLRNKHKRLHSHARVVNEGFSETMEPRLSATSSRGIATSIAESVVCLSPVILQNRLKICEMSGLFVLSSLQHSPMSCHTASVIPTSSAFSGFGGRSPKITACMTSTSRFG